MADTPDTQKKKPEIDLSGRTSWLGKIDAGIRAAANFVTFGYADKLDAMMSSGSYQENMEKNKVINEFDEEHNTAAVRTGQVGITVVAAAPGLVKAVVGKTLQVGTGLLAKATGRAATTEVAAARGAMSAAEIAAAEAAAAKEAAKAAAKAAKEVAKEAAKLAKEAAKPTTLAGKTVHGAGKLLKGGAKAAVGFGVPLAVADTLIDSATESKSSDKPRTAEEIAGINGSTVEGGASAVASAITLTAIAPGALAFAEKLGERVAERMGGRFKSLIMLGEKIAEHVPDSVKRTARDGVTHVVELAQSSATTMAKRLGLAYVAGETVAGEYVSDSNSNTPSRLVQTVDAVRDTYADIKKAGLDRVRDGSTSGFSVMSATLLVTELTEGLMPGIANISAKELKLLEAKDADFSNPHMRHLLARHLGSETEAISREIEAEANRLRKAFDPLLKGPGMPANPQEWAKQLASMSEEEMKAHPLYQFETAQRELMHKQNVAMQKLDDRWRPAQDNLDSYLASGKADLSNPAIAALAMARMEDNVASAHRKYAIAVAAEGSYNYREGGWDFKDPDKFKALAVEGQAAIVAVESKWKPVDQRMAALAQPQAPAATATAAAPAVEVTAQAPVAPAQQPAAVAKPAHKPATAKPVAVARPVELAGPPAPPPVPETPHESFNAQAALPDPDPAIAAAYAAKTIGATVTVTGLAPETVTLPPLVGAAGAALVGTAPVDTAVVGAGVTGAGMVDLSGLQQTAGEPAALPDPDLERTRPLALNTRAPNASTSFG